MKPVIFVDGSEGTTGLEINERLAGRSDIELRAIDPERRKDPAARKEMICGADLVFLCLPDAASREALALAAESPNVRFLDASTAHRTAPDWVYGLPELHGGKQRAAVKQARRVAIPGCHATGFNLIVAPLVKGGIVGSDYPVQCTSLTGFSGGGKKLIASYVAEPTAPAARHAKISTSDQRAAPRPYALGLKHKHIPEMQFVSGLDFPPAFIPIVADYYRGMAVCVSFERRLMKKSMGAAEIAGFLTQTYWNERFVRVGAFNDAKEVDDGFFRTLSSNGTNRCDITVFGYEEQTLVIARLDNLGKGASGAGIQCMNLMLGFDEGTGLVG
ncbi:MAG: N-acetyl-gamma-glutamyl-phosphate reductase [Opitutaceae bacterium]|jgi:N-acetyl-gamma-glutamyl-phosphate reductase